MSTQTPFTLSSSFRDPSGFVYTENGTIYRQVNLQYKEEYDLLISSGLYTKLAEAGLLVKHDEAAPKGKDATAYRILRPEHIPFISYPYEWSFSQLKDAALATLEIQGIALEHGMSLKDASAYNIQFLAGKPIFIDTLSFERYEENKPWIAYRQFCQHFLAPLALMAHVDLRLGTLSSLHLDGVPLDLASQLLPKKTKFSIGLSAHLHLHARSQRQHSGNPSNSKSYSLSKQRLTALLQNLEATVKALKLPGQKTVWGEYYDNTNYTGKARHTKEETVRSWVTKLRPRSVWDMGANDGTFSRIASSQDIFTVASDIDPIAIDHAYNIAKSEKDRNLLPLIIDMTNPSPAIGWENTERSSFLSRGSFDLTLCLALIHHLAIANNLPLDRIVELFSQHTRQLIIEFVPKDDSNSQLLLAAREDIFPNYTQEAFEAAFSRRFIIKESVKIPESSRVLYLLERSARA